MSIPSCGKQNALEEMRYPFIGVYSTLKMAAAVALQPASIWTHNHWRESLMWYSAVHVCQTPIVILKAQPSRVISRWRLWKSMNPTLLVVQEPTNGPLTRFSKHSSITYGSKPSMQWLIRASSMYPHTIALTQRRAGYGEVSSTAVLTNSKGCWCKDPSLRTIRSSTR